MSIFITPAIATIPIPIPRTVLVPQTYTFPRYISVNEDPKLHADVIRYYFYKIIDKWLYNDFS